MTKTRNAAASELTAPGALFEMEEVAVDGIPWRIFKNAPRSMRDVLASTSVYGDKPFLVYDFTSHEPS